MASRKRRSRSTARRNPRKRRLDVHAAMREAERRGERDGRNAAEWAIQNGFGGGRDTRRNRDLIDLAERVVNESVYDAGFEAPSWLSGESVNERLGDLLDGRNDAFYEAVTAAYEVAADQAFSDAIVDQAQSILSAFDL